MKWLVPWVAAFTLMGGGAAWAAQTGESQGSQAKKPFKSSETKDAKTTEQGSECEHSKKMKHSKSSKERGTKGTSEKQGTQTEQGASGTEQTLERASEQKTQIES